MRFKLVRVCESNALAAVPQESKRYDLAMAAEALKGAGYSVDEQGVMLIARKAKAEYTLYPNGRLLLHPASDKDEAKRTAEALYSTIERAVER
ncbi:MAG: hypothetical protein LUO79_04930 [Methanomassiliicoccales archaeon]|nr:hypothetical protein [Methanomassiliicoccales archaeon]